MNNRVVLSITGVLILFGGCLLPKILAAERSTYLPIKQSNMNPFTIIHAGLDPKDVLLSSENHTFFSKISFEMANHSVESRSGNEHIVIDGESYKTTVEFAFRLGKTAYLNVAIPIIYHATGIMDDAIEQWHDLFGLSNSRRSAFSSNQLLFRYSENDSVLVNIDKPMGGIGDTVISIGQSCRKCWNKPVNYSLNLDLKLPSGDSGELTGNNTLDWVAAVHASGNPSSRYRGLIAYGGAGTILLGDGKALNSRQESTVYSAYTGVHWPFSSRLALNVQLNYQTAYYESALMQLGKPSVSLLSGISYRVKERIIYQIAIGENVFTDSTPDFTVLFSTGFE